MQGDVQEVSKAIFWSIAEERGIRLKECEAVVDHVHMLIEAGSRQELSRAMNYLKGTSARRVFQRFPELKLDASTRSLWQHRYGFKEVPAAARAQVVAYIRTQWDRLDNFER
jgi:putative transposase